MHSFFFMWNCQLENNKNKNRGSKGGQAHFFKSIKFSIWSLLWAIQSMHDVFKGGGFF